MRVCYCSDCRRKTSESNKNHRASARSEGPTTFKALNMLRAVHARPGGRTKHLLVVAILCGCAISPQEFARMSVGEVCYLSARGAPETSAGAREELQRRAHTCTPSDIKAGADKIVHGRSPPPGM